MDSGLLYSTKCSLLQWILVPYFNGFYAPLLNGMITPDNIYNIILIQGEDLDLSWIEDYHSQQC